MDRLDFPPTAAVIALSFCVLWYIARRKCTPHQLPLPPGPKGIPILGNALQLNKHRPWLTYREWNKEFGEIVSCKLLGQTHIIINSARVANALLDQRSNIYSDRPVIQTSVLFGVGFNTGHLAYGDTWRMHRKLIHQTLSTAMLPKYYHALNEKARILLTSLLLSPANFEDHMRTYAASVIMSVTYGYNVIQKDDPFVMQLEEMIKILILMTPERAVLLNFFPWLVNLPTWFPGADLQRLAKRCKELSPKVRDGPFQFVKECLSKNIENDSMVAQLLRDDTVPAEARAEYEQNIKDSATSGFIAGTDTTQSVLNTMIMTMILFPEIQDRAQALIDKVVGRDRLPDFSDKQSLQYIEALLYETMRWASLVPMCVPHMNTKDDVFEQCLIPKGSIIIPNMWTISRDEERFPDPEAFRPERHLNADGNFFPDDLSCISFGYGRRVCAGRHLANMSNWIAAACMLSMFRFSKAVGPAGYEIDVFPKFEGGVSLRPVSFRCHIKLRFEGAMELLNDSS